MPARIITFGILLVLTTFTSTAIADIWYEDQDNDGYGNPDVWVDSSTQPPGYVSVSGDCNDQNQSVYPGAIEIVGDGVDQDCDGFELCYVDWDEDGWSINGTVLSSSGYCVGPGESPILTTPQDCNDSDAGIYPGATEIVGDGIDQDCDGGELCYLDSDNDGYRTTDTMSSADMDCYDPGEALASDPAGDCDDYNPSVHPGANEMVGDAIDQDCDGQEVCWADADGDGWTSFSYVVSQDLDCSDFGEAWDVSNPEDCDDGDGSIHPGATEIVGDGIDQDCDAQEICYVDADDDGYRTDNTVVSPNLDCTGPGEAEPADPSGDCDDTQASINPGAEEICGDLIDNDCDTEIDEFCTVFTLTDVADVGNDQGGQVRLTWNRISDDAPGVGADMVGYDVYRRIDANKSAAGDKAYPPGDWDFLTQVPASGEETYNWVAPTLCDSTDAGICWSVFFVRARTTDTYTFFDTEPDSGYSVDNLAPAAPTNLMAGYDHTGVALTWDECEDADFDYFRIYRSDNPDFVPGPSTLLHSTTGNAWTDPVVDGWHWHYKVTALDFAGNESPAGSIQQASDAPLPSLPRRLALHPNVPNPFNPLTNIRFEVPDDQHVKLEVFAVDGRRVKTLMNARCSAGRHSIPWDGMSDSGQRVASGSYVCRLVAGDQVLTRRMTLLK